jgi:hypothetical protein
LGDPRVAGYDGKFTDLDPRTYLTDVLERLSPGEKPSAAPIRYRGDE